ncbi:MAG: SusC/RagA family TonB-linked outer membrane protein [Bacteroidota bacterium]
MKRLVLLLGLLSLGLTIAFAQTTVSGKVTDSESGDPLEGVAVLIKGTTIGMFTDENGDYKIEIPATAEGDATLIYTYVGKATSEEAIAGRTTINVGMKPDALVLDEVVVTALGITKERKALGYAIQDVDGGEIQATNATSFIDGLNGKVSGVNIINTSGAAGGSSRVIVRGQNSLSGNNQALLVVDGVKINNSETATEGRTAGVALSNRGMDLNPDDIANVTVLKGAAATALYGADGSRGVVLITTKKGAKNSRARVDVSSTFTWKEANQLPALQNTYAQGVSGTWLGPDAAGFFKATSWGPAIDTMRYDGSAYPWDPNGRLVSQNDPSAGAAVVPYDNLGTFFQRGFGNQTNLGLSGGNQYATYRFSASNYSEQGIIPNNTFRRTTVGLTSSADMFNGKLKMQSNFNFTNSGGSRIQQGSNISGIMLGLLRTPPTFDNTNGLGAEEAVNNPASYTLPDGTQRNYRGGGGYDNPYWIVNNTPFNDVVNRVRASISLEYEVAPWLSLATNIGSDAYGDDRIQRYEIGSRGAPAGQVIEDRISFRQLDAYFFARGNTDIGDTKLNFTYNLGSNIFNTRFSRLTVQGDGLNFPGFAELSNTATKAVFPTLTRQRSFAVFGDVGFGYDDFIYVNATLRRDYLTTLDVPSAEFDPNAISVTYPSVNMSFVFSELMEPSSTFTFGKFLISYATVGNGPPTAYSTSTPFVPSAPSDGWTNGLNFPFGGISGYTLSNTLGNTTLTPAFTNGLEVGLDLRFFDNRVGVDFTYYSRQSIDEILAVSLPRSTGYSGAVLNSGQLTTNGFDVVLNLAPIRTKNLTWDLNLNFTRYRTVVDKLADGVETLFLGGFTGTGIYNLAGQPYGQIYGGAFMRANTADGKAFDIDMPYNPDGAIIIDDDPASATFGFPLADPLPRNLGNTNPDWLLGINSNLTYKGLTFSFVFDIKQGGSMWNGTQGALTFFGASQLTEDRDAFGAPLTEDAFVFGRDDSKFGDKFDYDDQGAIKESDGSANDIKVGLTEDWYLGNGGGFGDVDEGFVQDASFYRLRVASLSYALPASILSNTPFSRLDINVTGRNLLLFTPYEGVDPETSLLGSGSNGQGFDYFNMPGSRSYAVGINLSF